MHDTEQDTQGSRLIDSILQANKAGEGKGFFSVCSSNRWVLEASIRFAAEHGTPMMIEATPNQVNQYGGYSGQTPVQFARAVSQLAQQRGLPRSRLLLGGDHLGPMPWKGEDTQTAMHRARQLVRDFIHAGCQKIHLDASMSCADDPPGGGLSPETATARTAELCQAAEEAASEISGVAEKPHYVIGTEVPTAGGTSSGDQGIEVTTVKDVEHTLELTRQAFYNRGLADAWQRVIAVVVQPGVEFGDNNVHTFDPVRARELSEFITNQDRLVYEAHSTDYQTQEALRQLVRDHFCILKVGPELTFVFREAVFALAMLEQELMGSQKGIETSQLILTVNQAMLKEPSTWEKYYRGDRSQVSLARKFSYSDRIRYYWTQPNVRAALDRLLKNLYNQKVPFGLVSQYIPWVSEQAREDTYLIDPEYTIYKRINIVLEKYATACGYISQTA